MAIEETINLQVQVMHVKFLSFKHTYLNSEITDIASSAKRKSFAKTMGVFSGWFVYYTLHCIMYAMPSKSIITYSCTAYID